MADCTDKLRLKEQAEEDAYFARRDRERIKALRAKRLAESPEAQSDQRREASAGSGQKPVKRK